MVAEFGQDLFEKLKAMSINIAFKTKQFMTILGG
jgi:hypothetical protein